MKQKSILLILFLFVFGMFFIGAQETKFIDATYKIGVSEVDRRIELEKAGGSNKPVDRDQFLKEAVEFDARAVFDSQGVLKAYEKGNLKEDYLYRINGLILEISADKAESWQQAGLFSADMKRLTAKNRMIFDLLE